ncbi:MAG TPA: hypothetical protein VG895_01145 [Patescibacteria group bacterium]|nr:hypothetical protein [Patescibacteria group bacterium]
MSADNLEAIGRLNSEIKKHKIQSRLFKIPAASIAGFEILNIFYEITTKNYVDTAEVPAYLLFSGFAILCVFTSRKLDQTILNLKEKKCNLENL